MFLTILIQTIIVLLGLICVLFLAPFIYFLYGYIMGWIIKFTLGNIIVSGLFALGVDFPKDSLPFICGIISLIASFFRDLTFSYKANEDD